MTLDIIVAMLKEQLWIVNYNLDKKPSWDLYKHYLIEKRKQIREAIRLLDFQNDDQNKDDIVEDLSAKAIDLQEKVNKLESEAAQKAPNSVTYQKNK